MTRTNQKKISIIIPICNIDYPLAHYTGNCIGSVKYFTNNSIDYEIIVVDNNSSISLSGMDWGDEVDNYIKNEKNLGVPAAWNQGIEAANGDIIVFLNSDVEVYLFWLDCFLEDLQWVDVVCAHPMYANPMGRAKESYDKYKELEKASPPKFLSDFWDGSCFAVKREVLEKIGGFDENFGIGYGEDVDFKRKVEENGFKIKCDERVATHHIGMATGWFLMHNNTIDLNRIMDDNRKYYAEKIGMPIKEERQEVKEEVKNDIDPILGYKITS